MSQNIDDIDTEADTTSTWPPPIIRVEEPPRRESTAGSYGPVSREIHLRQWNWAALAFGPIWALASGLPVFGWILVGVFVLATEFLLGARPPSDIRPWFVCVGVDVVLRVFLVVRGYPLAWRSWGYPDGIGIFIATQRRWQRAAAVAFVLVGFVGAYVAYKIVTAPAWKPL